MKFKKLQVMFLSTVASASLITSASALVLFRGNFESANFSGWELEAAAPSSIQVVTSPVRSGSYAAKFTLNTTDPLVASGKRAEIRKKGNFANVGKEFWYGFSMYVPTYWATDPSSAEILAQLHDRPDTALGETWRSPQISLGIIGGKWYLRNRWDPKPKTIGNDPKPEGNVNRFDLGPVTKGVWTDWVVHAKWSYGSDGVLEIWKNGVPVVKYNGPNAYNDQKSPYWKFGVYKPDWKKPDYGSSVVTSRTLYLDNVRFGDSNSNYNQVNPAR